ncbi:DUF4175 domain-containing protein [Magnetospira thiophila]
MTSTPESPLDRLLARARAGLFWEQLWPRLWVPLSLLYLFLALAFADLLPGLPGLLHLGFLILFGLAVPVALWWGLRDWARVTPSEARHRLEEDSGLVHRPLTALQDRPSASGSDPRTAALWEAHRQRVRASLTRLHLNPPRPQVARRDPWALRTLPLLLLCAAMMSGWGELVPRLERALTPALGTDPPLPARLDLWITPPDYTGLPAVHRDLAGLGPLDVPQGSQLLIQVAGSDMPLVLEQGGTGLPLEDLGDGTRRGKMVLRHPGDMTLKTEDEVVAAWPLTLIIDQPPEISFAEPPEGTEQGRLNVAYRGHDDYGIRQMDLVLSLPGTDQPARRLALAPPTARDPVGQLSQDLARHDWAGQTASLRLWARDAAGNETFTDGLLVKLPTRIFTHPVARELARLRKRLGADRESRVSVALGLNRLKGAPEAFDHDLVVYLGLSVAQSRLLINKDPAILGPLRDLFWDLALRLEEGHIGLARRDLEAARQALLEALRDNAKADDLAALEARLRAAMDRMIRAMDQALRELPPDLRPLMESTRVVTAGDLQQMLDKLADLIAQGKTDAAMALLGDLGRLTAALESNPAGGMDAQTLRAAQELLDDLRQMEADQQRVMDETFRTLPADEDSEFLDPQQARPAPRTPPIPLDGLAKRQEDLSRQLAATRQKISALLGAFPQELEQAGLAMDRAGRALQAGRARTALPRESEALDGLRQGLKKMMQALAQQAGGEGGPPMMGRGPGQDPFGRRGDSPLGEGQTGPLDIPEAGAAERATRLRQEIQKRANQPQRPAVERSYLQRLLERD